MNGGLLARPFDPYDTLPPAITGLVDGERGNVVRDSTTFTSGNVPAGAGEIVSNAGPTGVSALPRPQ